MHEVLVNRLEGLSLPRKSIVRLTDHPDMTLDVYRGRKITIQQRYNNTDKFFTFGSIIYEFCVHKIEQLHMISNTVALMTSIDSDQTAHKSNLTETLLFISAIFGIDKQWGL